MVFVKLKTPSFELSEYIIHMKFLYNKFKLTCRFLMMVKDYTFYINFCVLLLCVIIIIANQNNLLRSIVWKSTEVVNCPFATHRPEK